MGDKKPLPPIQRVVDSYNGVPCGSIRPDSAPVRPGEPCGVIHDRCTSHLKANNPERIQQRGDPCQGAAMLGQLVCRKHGGGAPQNRVKGAAVVAEQKRQGEMQARMDAAMAIAKQMGGLEQLADNIDRAYSMTLIYQALLGSLDDQTKWSWNEHQQAGAFGDGARTRWVDVRPDSTPGVAGPDATGTTRLHPYQQALNESMLTHAKLIKVAADIGMDERRQTFAEQQVRSIVDAVRYFAGAMGHDLDDPAVVPIVETTLAMIVTPQVGP